MLLCPLHNQTSPNSTSARLMDEVVLPTFEEALMVYGPPASWASSVTFHTPEPLAPKVQHFQMSDKVWIRLLTGHFTWERDCFERESLILEICISTFPQHAMLFFFTLDKVPSKMTCCPWKPSIQIKKMWDGALMILIISIPKAGERMLPTTPPLSYPPPPHTHTHTPRRHCLWRI